MKKKQYTDQEIVWAVQDYLSGIDPSEIKRRYGMTRQYLNLCLKKLGIEPRENKHNWDLIKKKLEPAIEQPNPIDPNSIDSNLDKKGEEKL